MQFLMGTQNFFFVPTSRQDKKMSFSNAIVVSHSFAGMKLLTSIGSLDSPLASQLVYMIYNCALHIKQKSQNLNPILLNLSFLCMHKSEMFECFDKFILVYAFFFSTHCTHKMKKTTCICSIASFLSQSGKPIMIDTVQLFFSAEYSTCFSIYSI